MMRVVIWCILLQQLVLRLESRVDRGVQYLDEDNFDQFIVQYQRSIIIFQRGETLDETFGQVVNEQQQQQDSMRFGYVNCLISKQLCENRFLLIQYPYIGIFEDNTKLYEFKQIRIKENLVKFIQNYQQQQYIAIPQKYQPRLIYVLYSYTHRLPLFVKHYIFEYPVWSLVILLAAGLQLTLAVYLSYWFTQYLQNTFKQHVKKTN